MNTTYMPRFCLKKKLDNEISQRNKKILNRIESEEIFNVDIIVSPIPNRNKTYNGWVYINGVQIYHVKSTNPTIAHVLCQDWINENFEVVERMCKIEYQFTDYS